MKGFFKGLSDVLLVLMLLALGAVVFLNVRSHRARIAAEAQAEADAAKAAAEAQAQLENPSPSTPPEDENTEPEPGTYNAATARIAFAGETICHSGINTQAQQATGGYYYGGIFPGAAWHIQDADYAVCTLSTTLPNNGSISGTQLFATPSEFAAGLADTGIDLVSTASVHSLDSGKAGLDATLDVLDSAGLAHVGTYRSQAERAASSGMTFADVNGISVGFLAYTCDTNGVPADGFEYAVNIFHSDYLTGGKTVDYDLLDTDMASARASGADILVVMMNWGNEYYTSPTAEQTELADYFIKNGVDLIVGARPLVPEPIEERTVVDDSGVEHRGVVAYSLGSFISCLNDKYTNLTAVLNIDIEKNLDAGTAKITNIGYRPMIMVDTDDYAIVNPGFKYSLWDMHTIIDTYEQGEDVGVINDQLYEASVAGLADIHSVMGEQYDAYYYDRATYYPE